MHQMLMLLSGSANRVYAQAAPQLAAAEVEITAGWAERIAPLRLAGIDYLGFDVDELDAERLAVLAGQSGVLALFRREGELLAPVELPVVRVLEEDLVTIPRYQGKTNEHFTQLLVNLALSQVRTGRRPLEVLDPLAGRGTTLLTAWRCGQHAFGVEVDEKSFEAMAGYLKTYLRRKRLKHSAEVTPVRREGRRIGRRLEVSLRPTPGPGVPPAGQLPEELRMTVFTGRAQDSAALFGHKRFDAVVTDAPYGVVHGAHSQQSSGRDRSPRALLAESLPVWAGQLRPGGVLALAWNTHVLPREELSAMIVDAGLQPCAGEAWSRLGHRVDSSIHRDVLVAQCGPAPSA